jgi:hypothetical protein
LSTKKKMSRPINPRTATPPTAPPAIAPTLVPPPSLGAGVGVDEVLLDDAALDVVVVLNEEDDVGSGERDCVLVNSGG